MQIAVKPIFTQGFTRATTGNTHESQGTKGLLCYTKPKHSRGYKLHSLDGEIGKVKEFYFDDHHWTVRYLVADTGNWLTGRQVLISPYALAAVNKEEQYIAIDLTKKTD